VNLLSEYDVAVLQAARRVLDDQATAAKHEAVDLGRLAEAAETAEEGAFNVLNLAYAHLHDDNAREALRPPWAPELERARGDLRRALRRSGDTGEAIRSVAARDETAAERVRRELADDPTITPAEYAGLIEAADESDRARELEAERPEL
jgi:hypothetical protein